MEFRQDVSIASLDMWVQWKWPVLTSLDMRVQWKWPVLISLNMWVQWKWPVLTSLDMWVQWKWPVITSQLTCECSGSDQPLHHMTSKCSGGDQCLRNKCWCCHRCECLYHNYITSRTEGKLKPERTHSIIACDSRSWTQSVTMTTSTNHDHSYQRKWKG